MQRVIRTISWATFDECVNKIATHFEGCSIDGVYGEPRGGLALAVALSHKLQIPLVDRHRATTKTLWVDDIVDSGKTLNLAKGGFGYYAAMLGGPAEDCFYCNAIETGAWYVFPWECLKMAERDCAEYLQRHVSC